MADENVDQAGDEAPDTDTGDEGHDDDTDGTETEDEWAPPSRDDWTKVQATLKARKAERDAVRKELADLKAKTKSDDTPDEDDEGARWRRTAARSSAASALQAAGYQGTVQQARRLTRLLDLDTAEPDREGDFDWEDDVEALKEEFPSLFAAPSNSNGTRPPGRKVTTADRGGKGSPAPDPAKRTTDRLLRAGGYR